MRPHLSNHILTPMQIYVQKKIKKTIQIKKAEQLYDCSALINKFNPLIICITI